MRRVTIQHADKTVTMNVSDPRAWGQVVAKLVPLMVPGSIITFSGDLGAGKTTAIQVLAQLLHISKVPQSPTFALMRTYQLPEAVNGVKRLFHVDAYRIENEVDIITLDLDQELSDGETAIVLEWPEKIPQWMERHAASVITVRIDI